MSGESDPRMAGLGPAMRRSALWGERVLLALILTSLAATFNLLVAIHRRPAPSSREDTPAAVASQVAPDARTPLPVAPPNALDTPADGTPVNAVADVSRGLPQSPAPPELAAPAEDPTHKEVERLAVATAQELDAGRRADERTAAWEAGRQWSAAESERWKRREFLVRQQVMALAQRADRVEREVTELDAERDVLASERDALKAALAKAGRRSGGYAVLPYKGANGTWRRPIVLECTTGGVKLQPEGTCFTSMDLSPFIHPRASQFVQAIVRELRHVEGTETPDGAPAIPYLVFLVRPEGIRHYYEARTRLEALGIAFGYELIEQDLVVNVPDFDDLTTWDGTVPLEMPIQAAPRVRATVAQRSASDSGGSDSATGPPGSGGSPGSGIASRAELATAVGSPGALYTRGGRGSVDGVDGDSSSPADFVWPGRAGQSGAGLSPARGATGLTSGDQLARGGDPLAVGAGAGLPGPGGDQIVAGNSNPPGASGVDRSAAERGNQAGASGLGLSPGGGGGIDGIGSPGGGGAALGDGLGGGSQPAPAFGGAGRFGNEPNGGGAQPGVVGGLGPSNGAAGGGGGGQPGLPQGAGGGGAGLGPALGSTPATGASTGSGATIDVLPDLEPAGDSGATRLPPPRSGSLFGKPITQSPSGGLRLPAGGLTGDQKGVDLGPSTDNGGSSSTGGNRAGLGAGIGGAGQNQLVDGGDPAVATGGTNGGTGSGGTDSSASEKGGGTAGAPDTVSSAGALMPEQAPAALGGAFAPGGGAPAAAPIGNTTSPSFGGTGQPSAAGQPGDASQPAGAAQPSTSTAAPPGSTGQPQGLTGMFSSVSDADRPAAAPSQPGSPADFGATAGASSSMDLPPLGTSAGSASASDWSPSPAGAASSDASTSSSSSTNMTSGVPLGSAGSASSSSSSGFSLSVDPSTSSTEHSDDFVFAPPPRLKPPLGTIEVPFEIVVVCRQHDVSIHPGGYRLTAQALRAEAVDHDSLLAREVRAVVRKRAVVDPMIRPRPTIKFLVENDGAGTFWAARRQLLFSLPDWPTSLQVAGSQRPHVFSEETW